MLCGSIGYRNVNYSRDLLSIGFRRILTEKEKGGANVDIANMHKSRMVLLSEPDENLPIQKQMVSPKYTTNWWDLPQTK